MKEAAELFKILAVDTRIGIIELLKEGPKNVNTLAEALGITQSAVSQHLRILKAAGLVRDERQGYWVNYSLDEDKLDTCRERLNEVCTCGCDPESCTPPRRNKPGKVSRRSLERYRAELKEELKKVEEKLKELKE
jgi:DNA-binding transcriptional ArsR family regulator